MYSNTGQLHSSTLLAEARFPDDKCGMGVPRSREGCRQLTTQGPPSVLGVPAPGYRRRLSPGQGPGLGFFALLSCLSEAQLSTEQHNTSEPGSVVVYSLSWSPTPLGHCPEPSGQQPTAGGGRKTGMSPHPSVTHAQCKQCSPLRS